MPGVRTPRRPRHSRTLVGAPRGPPRPAGEVRQVSTDGGIEPVWAPSGRELFFRQGDKMMVADVATAPVSSTSRPRVLFEGRYETSFLVPGMRFYDVSPDGQRFLMVKSDTQAAPRQLRLVVN